MPKPAAVPPPLSQAALDAAPEIVAWFHTVAALHKSAGVRTGIYTAATELDNFSRAARRENFVIPEDLRPAIEIVTLLADGKIPQTGDPLRPWHGNHETGAVDHDDAKRVAHLITAHVCAPMSNHIPALQSVLGETFVRQLAELAAAAEQLNAATDHNREARAMHLDEEVYGVYDELMTLPGARPAEPTPDVPA